MSGLERNLAIGTVLCFGLLAALSYISASPQIAVAYRAFRKSSPRIFSSANTGSCDDLFQQWLKNLPEQESNVTLPGIVVLATHSRHTAVLLYHYLAAAGIPHQRMGQKSTPARHYTQEGEGDGVALIVETTTPFGLPHNLPIVYVVESPLQELACKALQQQAGQPVSNQQVETAVKTWQTMVADWMAFGRHHNNRLTVLHLELMEQRPASFWTQLLQGLGANMTAIEKTKSTQQVEQAYRLLASQLAQRQVGACEHLQQLGGKSAQPVGCYSQACNASTHTLPLVPCNSSYGQQPGPLASFDITTFEHSRFAALVDGSPKRFVATTRRVCMLTSYYTPSNAARARELLLALTANVQNPYIDEVHLFVHPDDEAAHLMLDYTLSGGNQKVVVQHLDRQPTHKDAIEYANDKLTGHIVIWTNADIVFSQSLQLSHQLRPGHAWALSRHVAEYPEYFHGDPGAFNPKTNYCFNYLGSHDTFMFIPPISPNISAKLDHVQSLWGSENVVLYEFKQGGIKVSNPCRDIVSFHVHTSGKRATNRPRINRVRSATAQPTALGTCSPAGSACCEFNCWTYSTQDGMLHDAPCKHAEDCKEAPASRGVELQLHASATEFLLTAFGLEGLIPPHLAE